MRLITHLRRATMKFIDIGANLTDPVFTGVYRGKQKHENDFADMLQRARDVGMDKVIVTAGCLKDCKEAEVLCEENQDFYFTAGCHPTRCDEFKPDPEKYLDDLMQMTSNKRVVAIGECGLDYDRFQFCDKETQLKYFELQLQLAKKTKLPMFLHCRSAFEDFVPIIKQHRNEISGGVVHSFTGTIEEAKIILDLDLFIGINGCSLKTKENIEAMKTIPSEKLMLETDCPWCDIRPTHAGHHNVETKFETKRNWAKNCCVKGRNELCNIVQVLEVIAKERGEEKEKLADLIYENTQKMFFPDKDQ